MKIHIAILFIFIAAKIVAQTSFRATVSKNKVTVNERFTLDLTLTDGNGKNMKVPALDDFYILGGPNQSSQYETFNGKTSESFSYNYVLQARRSGKFTIGSASIQSGGKTFTTQPITIEVSEKPITKGSDQTTDLNAYVRENFFLKVEVSDDEIYLGEQTTAVFKLYKNRNSKIGDHQIISLNKVPKFNGFYVQDADESTMPSSFETINGKQYVVYLLKKSFLTAQQSGNLEIDPFTVDAIIEVKTGSAKKASDPFGGIFGDPFSSNSDRFRVSVASPSVQIKVNELPPNAPSDFNGAAGLFTMKTSINTTATKTDEPLTYRVIINGVGNLNLIEAPSLNLPPDWETYEPKITEGDKVRTFEYLLIPHAPGEFMIPSHTWSYFDPGKKQYVTLNSESYSVEVTPGPGYTGKPVISASDKEDVTLLNKDIRYINIHTPAFEQGGKNLRAAIFYSTVSAPFLLGIFIFIFSARRTKLESNVVALKNRRATAIAGKRLKQAKILAEGSQTKAFYNETIRAIWGYLSDKFNIPQSDLSKDNIRFHLQQHQVTEALRNEVLQLLDQCEMALFAPQLAADNLPDVYRKAEEIILKLETEIVK